MYDYIKAFSLTNEKVSENYLNIVFDGEDKITKQRILIANLSNMKVIQNCYGISLKGSPAKYFFNNNLETLTRQATERAIERISDELCFKIKDSRVYKIDVATNIFTKEDFREYINWLGDLQYFDKSKFNDSLYYTNSKRQVVIYNKLKEMRRKGVYIPKDFFNYIDRNLRIELRIKNRLRNEFKRIVTISDLYDEDFYIMMLDKWKETYFKINKINKINYNIVDKLTSNQVYELIFSELIMKEGYDSIMQKVDLLRNKCKTSVEASRCKSKIKSLIQNRDFTETNDLINELDSKVIQAVAKYR